MDFQAGLLDVAHELSEKDVQALAFLCTDLLDRDLSGVSTAGELFTMLQNQELLSLENPSLLTELLEMCKLHRLVRRFHLPSQVENRVSSYRRMLFEVAENITTSELKSIKFLLHNDLSRAKLDRITTMLQLILEMEKEDQLNISNLEMLETVVGKVNPRLKRSISLFRNQASTVGMCSQGTGAVMETSWSFEQSAAPSILRSMPSDTQEPWMTNMQETESNTTELPPSTSEVLYSLSLPASNDCGLEETVTHLKLPCTGKREELNSTDQELGVLDSSVDNQALGVYEMKREKRGFCLIINNYDFSQTPLNNREGTNTDEKNLKAVFDWLGFETLIARDCSRQCMLSELQELSKRDHTFLDCLVCCVLSHGSQGAIYGVDGNLVDLRELMAPFSGRQCTSLQKKPKLFFVQACQGTREQDCFQVQTDKTIEADAYVPMDTLPADADFLMGMATVPNFASYRDKIQGSWYICALCEKLTQLVPRGVDLLSILTEVNNQVSQKTDRRGTKKQMPKPEYTLRKKVVFPKPKTAAPPLIL